MSTKEARRRAWGAGAAVLLAATTALGGAAAPAAAVEGPPDGQQHPQAGVLMATMAVGGAPMTYAVCSGALLGPSTLVTAGHCFAIEDVFDVSGWWVSFEAALPAAPEDQQVPGLPPVRLDDAATVGAIAVVGHETFSGARTAGNPAFADVAVARLARPVVGVDPITLPSAGLLDRWRAEGALDGRRFDLVGYGAGASFSTGPRTDVGNPLRLSFDGDRHSAAIAYRSLTAQFLFGSQNPEATGNGGGAWSDSGAPWFDRSTGDVVALQMWGDGMFRSLAGAQRLDIPEVLAFLAEHAE